MGTSTVTKKVEGRKMKLSLIILLSLAVLMSLFIPAIEAAVARRRGKSGRRGGSALARRGRQQGRKGRGRVQARRGRQDADVAAADENGITDFGPYGGVPESCPNIPEEEGEEEE